MTDRRRHRGPHPTDGAIFSDAALPTLQAATADLCWLLSRGYPRKAALQLVGNRFDLVERQRIAISRSACSDDERARRAARLVAPTAIDELWIDGFNVLTTVEAALAGGVLLLGRDGALRDMASMHGTYRTVDETRPALLLIGEWLASQGIGKCRWLLDAPVSNSGRLRGLIEELARERGWDWRCELVPDPDPLLVDSPVCIATADSAILDAAKAPWLDLSRAVVLQIAQDERGPLVDLGAG